MSDQLDIVVKEEGAAAVATKIRSIASTALTAGKNVDLLQKALSALKIGDGVVKGMNSTLKVAQDILKAQATIVTSNTRLMASQLRLEAQSAKTAQAQAKLATEVQKTQAAMAATEAAVMRAVAAEAKASQEAVKLGMAQTKAAQETAKLGVANAKAAQEVARLAVANNNAATAAQRLATEQARTAAVVMQSGVVMAQVAAANSNAATAAQRLTTEQQRTAAAASIAAQQLNNLSVSASRVTTAQNITATSAARLSTEQQRTAREAANAAAATDRAALAALRLQQAQDKAKASVGKANNALGDYVKTAIVAAGLAGSAAATAKAADAYTDMRNKLVNLAETQRGVNTLTEKMFEIAQKTRQPVVETTKAFQRFDMAMVSMGASQEETLRMTETVNKAIVVSGATASESAAGLLQLAQAFGSGRLQGDEFRSIMENLPVVADMIAKSLGKTRNELKAMSTAGLLTAEVMRKAFREAADDIDRRFGNTVPTMSQALVVLKDQYTKWIGELDKSLGLSASVSKAILWLADNMKALGLAAVAAGGLMLVAFGPGLISLLAKARAAMVAFNVAAAANPVLAVIAAVALATAAFIAYGDSIKVTADDMVSLKDVTKSVVSLIGDQMSGAWDMAKGAWSVAMTQMDKATASFGVKFSNTLNWVVSLLKHNANTFIGTWLGVARSIGIIWDNLPAILKVGFTAAVNLSLDMAERVFNSWQTVLRKIAEISEEMAPTVSAGLTRALDAMTIKLPRIKMNEGDLADVKAAGTKIGKTMSDAVNADYLGDAGDAIMKRAREIAAARIKAEKEATEGELRGAGKSVGTAVDEKAAAKAAKALAKLKKELAGVRGEVSPADEALRKLARAQEILTKATQTLDPATGKVLITQEQAANVMDRLRKKYEDALDPVGAHIRALERQTETYKYLGHEQENQAALAAITRDLETKNITVTKEMTAALMQRIEAERELGRQNAARNAVLGETVLAQQGDLDKINATGDLKKSGDISGGQAAQSAMGIFGEEALAATQEGFDAYTQQYDNMMAKIQAARDADVISAQTAEKLKLQAQMEYVNKNLATAQTFFGTVAQMSSSSNKKLAAIGKAAAIVNATISTYESATKAYAAMAGIPIVGPVLGGIAAGAAVVAGMQNVAAIRSQNTGNFRTGGDFTVGGSGGTDSQMVQFHATPGEQVHINTPSQARALENADKQNQERTPRTTVVNQTIYVQGSIDNRTASQLDASSAQSQRRAEARFGG